MREFVTDAIVLSLEPLREHDKVVLLYTKELGKIRAKVAGAAKPLSKFAPHLDPMNHVVVRLAHKRGFTITDALTADRFNATKKNVASFSLALRMLVFIAALSPEGEPDARIWEELYRSLTHGSPNLAKLANIFGYDLARAGCERCGEIPAQYFAIASHALLCANCSARIPEKALLLLR